MGNFLGQPLSASVSFGDFRTDPHNAKFLQQDYNQDGAYLTRNWVSSRWNPFLGAVQNEMEELQESVSYNYRSLLATGIGMLAGLIMVVYYAFSYLRIKWRKKKENPGVGVGGDLNLHLPMLEAQNGNQPIRVGIPNN